MTELAETVKLGVVSESKGSCPFEHKDHKCGTARNKLEGDAKALGDQLELSGSSGSVVTRTQEEPYKDFIADTGARAYEAYPEVRPSGHPSWINWVQLIRGNANTWYPVVFQAHHLIPAAGSLQVAPKLLKFIEAKGSAAICCDLGYDVNGKENGLWLPGKSAVAGGDLGIKLWGSGVATRSLPDKEYATRRAVPRLEKGADAAENFAPLGGATPSSRSKAPLDEVFHPHNLKWLYVKAAMNLATPKRQFHDSHTTYYNKVKDHLQNIGIIFENFRKPGLNSSCDTCSKPNAKQPSPAQLLGVLNKLSDAMKKRLVKKEAHMTYFTSNWCDAAKVKKAVALRKKAG